MKKALMIALLITPTLQAAPYVEYKYKSLLEDPTVKTSSFTRVGYKFSKNYYMEVGDGSAEAGYKFKKGGFTLKGKLESTKDFSKNGLETEIRYTFQK
tara:strand:- start:4524 stop:4817 length:294 start_codon:yes stop_codon:yes gene_type:complete